MGKNGQGRDSSRHPLTGSLGLSSGQIGALRGRWIETAEQLLSAMATNETRKAVADMLGLDDEEAERLLKRLSETVGLNVACRLLAPQAGGATGAILTEEQRRRFGIDDPPDEGRWTSENGETQ